MLNRKKVKHFFCKYFFLKKTFNGTIVKYVYGNGLISSYETKADTTEYQSYSYDIRGSVTRISDENGIATSEYLYSTYGQRTVLYGTGASILGYCGRDGVLTDATGLLYMRARYYSTELMRFINEDIIVGDISNSGSLNRYTYVEGNPVTNVDPFGLCAERIENGIWGLFNCAKGGGMAVCGTLAVIAGVATIAAGGPFIAMLLAAGAIGAGAYEAICGTADFTEGLQQLYSAVTGKENSAFNFVRDTIFKDNVDEYYLSEALAAGIASNCVGMLSAFQAVASDSTNSEGGTNSGYYQDATGKWHRPNGEFASNAEVGISSSVKTTTGSHGNSLSDPRTNYGYALVDKDTNEILKFGETLYPDTRYSQSFLDQENAVMKVLVSGSKEDIHYWQYDMNKYFEYKYDDFPRLLNSKGW